MGGGGQPPPPPPLSMDCSAPLIVTLPLPLVAGCVSTCVERSTPPAGLTVTLTAECVAGLPPVEVACNVPLIVREPLEAAPGYGSPGSRTLTILPNAS